MTSLQQLGQAEDKVITNPPDKLNSIKIGDYIFEGCYCFDHTQNSRQTCMIFLKSTHYQTPSIENKFIVYQSLSELGLWRLFCPESQERIYKGKYDYIQQTMININLQVYLDNFFLTSEKSSIQFTKYYDEFITSQYDVKIYIDNMNRQVDVGKFIDRYRHIPKCGFLDRLSINLLSEISQELESKYRHSKPIIINKINKTINLDPLYTATLKGYIFSTELTKLDLSFRCILYFIRYTLEIPCIKTKKIPVEIQEQITDDIQSKIQVIKPINDVINYYAPIVIVNNDSISKYGTYEHYIIAGAYICKILDYDTQSPRESKPCSLSYNFIGEIYQTIFPYKNFKPEEIDQLVCEYESSNLIKYLKYKEKYFKLKNKLNK